MNCYYSNTIPSILLSEWNWTFSRGDPKTATTLIERLPAPEPASFEVGRSGMSTATVEEMGLDDIKKVADTEEVRLEIINNANAGLPLPTGNTNGHGPEAGVAEESKSAVNGKTAGSSAPRPNKFFSSLSPNTKKTSMSGSTGRPKPTRQYSNMFPCPLIRSVDLESPEGSVSSLGLVNSAPFASMAMTSVHARRARRAYSSRTSSCQSGEKETQWNCLLLSQAFPSNNWVNPLTAYELDVRRLDYKTFIVLGWNSLFDWRRRRRKRKGILNLLHKYGLNLISAGHNNLSVSPNNAHLSGGSSAPSVHMNSSGTSSHNSSRWPQTSRLLPPRQYSLPAAPNNALSIPQTSSNLSSASGSRLVLNNGALPMSRWDSNESSNLSKLLHFCIDRGHRSQLKMTSTWRETSLPSTRPPTI